MLYSTPACAVKTIVPVGTPHVGWVVLATVGAAGAVGTALIIALDEGTETQLKKLVVLKV